MKILLKIEFKIDTISNRQSDNNGLTLKSKFLSFVRFSLYFKTTLIYHTEKKLSMLVSLRIAFPIDTCKQITP